MFYGLYIILTVTQRISRILEAMFKFALKSCLSQVKSKSCDKANSSTVMPITNKFEDGRMNLRILVLKIEKLSDFLRQGSKLFHPIMVNGKKEVFENVVFWVYKGNVMQILIRV